MENLETIEILQSGKNFAESNEALKLSKGKRLREFFKDDLATILHDLYKNSGCLNFNMVMDESIKYNIDMWYEFKAKAPKFDNDTTKAFISYEVLTAIKELKLNNFDFDQTYSRLFELSKINYYSYKTTGKINYIL